MNQKLGRFGLALLVVSALCTVRSAHADDVADYYRLQPLSVKEVPATPEELYSVSLAAPLRSSAELQTLGLGMVDWNTMVTIGEKLLELVKAGAPVTNITRNWVQVLPAGVTAWSQLSGWKSPATKVYSVTAKNYLGMTVIDMRLKVTAMYGGGLDGRGKFLTNVSIVPSSVYVLWGFRADVWGEHGDGVNVANTREDPVAGLGFEIRYKYGSVLNTETGTQDYFVTGDGTIEQK